MSVFVELLRIKEFRETKAETEVSRARLALAEARGAEEKAAALLAEFRQHALRHERALYADLCTRLVKLREIESVQAAVLELRGGERSREERLAAAQKAHLQATRLLEEARELHRLALRMKEKFVELARSYDEERLKELQRVEDLEMEEVHRVTQDREEREEWEEAHRD